MDIIPFPVLIRNDKSGNIIVEGFGGVEGVISGDMILGVLIEVIPFKEEKWENCLMI